MVKICSEQKQVHAEIYPQHCYYEKRHGSVYRKRIAEIHKIGKDLCKEHPSERSKHRSGDLLYIFKLKAFNLKTVAVLINERIRLVPDSDYLPVAENTDLRCSVLRSSVRHPGVHEREDQSKDNKCIKESRSQKYITPKCNINFKGDKQSGKHIESQDNRRKTDKKSKYHYDHVKTANKPDREIISLFADLINTVKPLDKSHDSLSGSPDGSDN